MRYSSKIKHIVPSASMKSGLGSHAGDYINLAIGIPDIPPPREVVDIISSLAGSGAYRYLPVRGTEAALRNLAGTVLAGDAGIGPGNLSLVSGAKLGVYLTLKTLCNPGDTVILTAPYWLSYPDICRILDLETVVWQPEIRGEELVYDTDALQALVARHRPAGIVINQPNNPSGYSFPAGQVEVIQQLMKDHDGVVVFDEVYRDFLFYGDARFDFDYDVTVRVGSLSKSLSVTGLRLGYVAGGEEFISNFALVSQHISTCVNSISNGLAERLTRNCFERHVAEMKAVYRSRYEFLAGRLQAAGIRMLKSRGTFYTLVDFGSHFTDGEQAVGFLERELKVLATAGLHYGESFGRYVRICLTTDTETLGRFADRLTASLNPKG